MSMQNGKGDKWRKTDVKKFFDRFDAINFSKTKSKKKPKPSQPECQQ